ncbi:hypothetical protein HZF05_21570 [Sphingomonas sp. CGMCC 1.13654]|uniref:Uncharacterized protein n=1 Tax=Sphingomonas chungangi TaxID=2683589 RepID=A0A838LCD7_9SPHN|nr:hypothetical protein [Sphingomonas chungangi]MBA2936677.1 hypothetical protein [Sphingomonas chungangi]MVW56062.1 hypothetical protein [Sphingomonas chungangi]
MASAMCQRFIVKQPPARSQRYGNIELRARLDIVFEVAAIDGGHQQRFQLRDGETQQFSRANGGFCSYRTLTRLIGTTTNGRLLYK